MDPRKLYEMREINYFENIEFEFSRNFVRYIKTYNQLDSNIGYTISILVGTPYPQLTYPLIGKLTTQEKMAVLKKIVKERFAESNPEMINDYYDWIDKASKTRTERNQYIHGYWHLSCSLDEKPIFFSPLTWEIKKTGSTDQKFSLEEYKSIVDELENICLEFGNLRNKHQL